MNHELFTLHRIRLDRDWTYQVMADRIGISRRNLFRLCRDPHAGMHDRTRAKIHRFISRTRPRRRSVAQRRAR